MRPIEFCPAVAAAEAVRQADHGLDQIEDIAGGAVALPEHERVVVFDTLERLRSGLIDESELARDRLAMAEAVSPAGAIIQLLAALRDARVRDEREIRRSRALEARAMGYLSRSGLLDADCVRSVSQSPGLAMGLDYPASRAISASESS